MATAHNPLFERRFRHLVVTSVDFDTVAVFDPRDRSAALIEWAELRDAASQEDAELARRYRRLLERAEALAAKSRRFRCEIRTDGGGGKWTAAFWGPGGVGVPRAADEGRTLPVSHLAEMELAERSARLVEAGWTKD